jgi:long-chain acyl-CoA synthetase
VIADFAAHLFSNATVALYDTLGPEACEFIINHSGIPIIITTLDKVANLLKIAHLCPGMKAIVVMDDHFPAIKNAAYGPFNLLKQWATEKGLQLYRFSEIESIGKKHLIPPRLPKPSDVFWYDLNFIIP